MGIVLAAGRRKRARVPWALVAAASLAACLAVIAVPSSAAETPPSFTHRVVDADLAGFLRRTVAAGSRPQQQSGYPLPAETTNSVTPGVYVGWGDGG